MSITPWTATCIQMAPNSLQSLNGREEAKASIIKSIDAGEQLMKLAVEREARDLILFPEFVFSGGSGPGLIGVVDWMGPEMERLQAVAQRHRIFIAANLYTRTPDFPGRYLNTNFILDRSGEVVLKSYRLHTYHSSSPHDYWQAFLDKVGGIEGAFPVAKTELGNLSMLASMELLFPEVARAMVLNGAEVLLHSTAEAIVDESVKRTRATENMAYLVSSNTSAQRGGDRWMNPGSRIVNFRGQVMAEVDQGVVGQCTAVIDVEGLRRRRTNLDFGYPPYGANYLSRFRVEMFREVYASKSLFPPETYQHSGDDLRPVSPEVLTVQMHQARDNMVAAGMIPPVAGA
jgi:predicted amidohydrolase